MDGCRLPGAATRDRGDSGVAVRGGDRDEVIPFEMGQALYAAAPEPKQFWRVAGAHHSDIPEFAAPEYRERMAAFFAGLP
jgi:fermentation-respiration switch protein FrsA (DUF1100 family)